MDGYIYNILADTTVSLDEYMKIPINKIERYVYISGRTVCIQISASRYIVLKNAEKIIVTGEIIPSNEDGFWIKKGVITVELYTDKAYSIKHNGHYIELYKISKEYFRDCHDEIYMELLLENNLIQITEANLSYVNLYDDSANIEGEIKFKYKDIFKPVEKYIILGGDI